MNCITKSAAVLSLVLVMCCSCDPLDMSKIKVGPGNTVSWEDAKTIIKDGNVKTVFQSHALRVKITLASGTSYQTTEPEIDDVIEWLEKCGKRDSVGIMTE